MSAAHEHREGLVYAPRSGWMVSLALLAASVVAGAWGVARWQHRPPPVDRIAWLKTHAPAGMVFVPAGYFWMGSDSDEGTKGRRREWTPSFYIDKYPVTNREYASWDPHHHYPRGQENYPVTNVTWSQATAYLKAHGKVLPTEAEWEKAARGTDGRVYPWGNKPEHYLDRSVKGRAFRPVDRYSQPASPYGAHDMCGAVWQWVRDNLDNNPHQQIIRGGAAGYARSADTTFNRGIEGAGVT